MSMKRNILSVGLAIITLTSCYKDYIIDSDTQAVGFANQTDVRSVIVGEGMKFSTAVALAGVIKNGEDRRVDYSVDNSLVNEETLAAMKVNSLSYITSLVKPLSSLKVLPSSEYSLINEGGETGSTIIRKGTHSGKITVKIDSVAFLGGSASLVPEHVVAFRINDGHGLGIIEGRETTVIGVRYENMLFGNWWHGGKAVVKNPEGVVVEEIRYSTEIPQTDNKVWTLTTVEPFSLTANAVGNELNSSSAQMKLTLENNGKITVNSVPGAKYEVESDGESTYNQSRLLQNRKIFLSYKYKKDGNVWHVTDTLTFRNRIRDGVNEWQDENQDNYK